MLERLTAADFFPLRDSEFTIALDDGARLKLRLIDVTAQGAAPPGLRAPFSLLFRGPRAPALPQRIYSLEHSQLGTLGIFLVPMGPDSEGMRYEAVFG